jgi:UDP:flavonoid glycosyltransferase YjiC (YdhE family)
MSDILFVTWDGGGNVPPALGIAAQLKLRGHTVRFLGHARQREAIAAAGFDFQPYAHARSWSAVAPHPGIKGLMRQLDVFADRGMGADLLQTVHERPADLVIIDCLLFGALQAAERAGLRRAVLVHTLYGQQRATWSTGMGGLRMRLSGLRPVALWTHADLALVTTLRAIDQCAAVPVNVHFTGPVWQNAQPEPAEPPDGEPLVLVSLSTLYQDGQVKALQAILDGLAPLPVRVVLTTGPSIEPAALRAPANAQVLRYVNHDAEMSQASLVVGHGGHGTTMTALAHDLPLVIMPMFALGDQPAIGHALERLGAARVLPKNATAERIAAAVQEMLPDGPHRAAARALGAMIREHDGAEAAADVLERLLAPVRV